MSNMRIDKLADLFLTYFSKSQCSKLSLYMLL